MLLRKVRCFRLGRTLIRVSRCIHRVRSRRNRRLENDRLPLLAPARRLLRWISSLRLTTYVASISDGGSEASKMLLLEGEERPPPKGHLAVYVGDREEDEPPQRYMVPVLYFNHPLFGELLREAKEEFGFHHPRGITIPCPPSRFEMIQTRIAAGVAVARR